MNDLLGNQIDATFVSPGTAANYPDKIKVLAITGTKRVARLPNVPTFDEAGISTLKQSGWGGIFLPSSTPRPIVNKLSAEIARIGLLPEVVQKTNNAGYPVSVAEAQEFERFVNAEYGYWADIFKRYNIKAE
jgi:tripartite-type tricarboxylate transporter receptor subunit TctC